MTDDRSERTMVTSSDRLRAPDSSAVPAAAAATLPPRASTAPSRPSGPSATLPPDPSAGPRRHLGQYEVVRFLGKGGMGCVYEGLDTSLQRRVAIKELSPALTTQPELVERFRHEARIVATLNHPNICDIYVLGDDPATGAPWYAMEYVEGENLDQIMAREGPLPLSRAARYMAQTAEALRIALTKDIIHRDIKPANVMVTADGTVKVTDFGLAKLMSGGAALTQANVIMGTPHYMSPEAAQGLPCDWRSDVYSLGATLYHVLTGHLPFDGPSALSVLQLHLTAPVPDPVKIRADLPREASALIRRLLAKKPELRASSYEDLVAELLALAGPDAATTGSPTEALSSRSRRRTPATPAADASAPLAAAARAAGAVRSFATSPEVRQAVQKGGSAAVSMARTLAPRIDVRRRWKLKLPLAAAVAVLGWLALLHRPGMVYVPGGVYRVGRQGSLTEVTLAPFHIDRYEVTNARYAAALGLPPPAAEVADLPKIIRTPNDVRAYLDATGLQLPSEVQWQAAARGPAGLPFPWGDDRGDEAHAAGVVLDDRGLDAPLPGGSASLDVSPCGARDMAGNVRECVRASDGDGSVAYTLGASYDASLSAYAMEVEPGARRSAYLGDDVGFRTVAELGFVARVTWWVKALVIGLAVLALALFL